MKIGDNMKKKVIIIVALVIASILMTIGIAFGISSMFTTQYNSKGISHFLVVTIDNSQLKEYIGRLEDHDVYIEGLNITGTNFRSVDAENVSIKYAIDNNLVSIEEWKKYAWRVIESGNGEILRYDNYEIYVDFENCIIRPISN